ncbi:hypothetical protein BGW36DRAFT_424526 [Talaromyces proteolyticus]|uniref:Uncharacterized protein n=1 Tax=Talaromyces proteolyticus TaxID=1131652 RepID=A0AAD4Q1G0_9EURO|nr:uncharacterized protein BGW36DRAFT_424526 [Talaromyces proteolyticus]KAH8702244.1 hypothetical protein BGW36DRAFT_424526 [Talaromyces proteolyticus]
MPQRSGTPNLAGLSNKRDIIADLYTECMKFYRIVLRRTSLNRDIPKSIYRGLESSYSSLILWAQGYGVAAGNLDRLLKKSRLLQRMTLEPLIRICRVLMQRLHIQFTSRSSDSTQKNKLLLCLSEAKIVWYTIQDELQDPENEGGAYLYTSDSLDEDSLEDMVADLKTDVQCLIDLDSMYECPISDLDSGPSSQHGGTLASRDQCQKFVDQIYRQFPLADRDLVHQLAWFLNGFHLVRESKLKSKHQTEAEVLLKTDVEDALKFYFKTLTLHERFDSICPLCGEYAENNQGVVKLHIPQHVDKLYLLALPPTVNKASKDDSTESNATEKESSKSLSTNLPQRNKGKEVPSFTNRHPGLHDSTKNDPKNDAGIKKFSDQGFPLKQEIAANPKASFRPPPDFLPHLD